MEARIINLDYSDTLFGGKFGKSGSFFFSGHGDGFLSVDRSGKRYIDGSKGDGRLKISIIGAAITAHKQEPKTIINVGDQVMVEGTLYTVELDPRHRGTTAALKLTEVQ